jgi:predicted GNAT family acetyltransferase
MIRKLTELDRQKVLKYLYTSPSLNIFIIGDIESFGFENDFQTLYGQFDDNNNYLSVLLFYRENVVFYSHIDHFDTAWLETINNHNFLYFSGRKLLIDLIYPHLSGFEYKEMYFAEAKELTSEFVNNNNITINKMETKEDALLLYNFLKTITEFGVDKQTKDYFVDSKMNGKKMGVTYFVKEEGKVISTVATTAETTKNAMIIGVATAPTARKRGLASYLMTYLMKEYFTKDKYLCLFYDNPLAGVIYKRLGFKDTEKWVMINKR